MHLQSSKGQQIQQIVCEIFHFQTNFILRPAKVKVLCLTPLICLDFCKTLHAPQGSGTLSVSEKWRIYLFHSATYGPTKKTTKNLVFCLTSLVLARGQEPSVNKNAGFSWAFNGLVKVSKLQWALAGIGGPQGAHRGPSGVTSRCWQVSGSTAAAKAAQTYKCCLQL